MSADKDKNGIQEVAGSIPVGSTNKSFPRQYFSHFFFLQQC